MNNNNINNFNLNNNNMDKKTNNNMNNNLVDNNNNNNMNNNANYYNVNYNINKETSRSENIMNANIVCIKEGSNPKYNKEFEPKCISAINKFLNNPDMIAKYISDDLQKSYSNKIWFVLVCESNENDFDFKIPEIASKNLIIYNYCNLHVYICPLE